MAAAPSFLQRPVPGSLLISCNACPRKWASTHSLHRNEASPRPKSQQKHGTIDGDNGTGGRPEFVLRAYRLWDLPSPNTPPRRRRRGAIRLMVCGVLQMPQADESCSVCYPGPEQRTWAATSSESARLPWAGPWAWELARGANSRCGNDWHHEVAASQRLLPCSRVTEDRGTVHPDCGMFCRSTIYVVRLESEVQSTSAHARHGFEPSFLVGIHWRVSLDAT